MFTLQKKKNVWKGSAKRADTESENEGGMDERKREERRMKRKKEGF